MAEARRSDVTPLVEVRLLHHYWLDDGATVFAAADSESAGADRSRRLRAYDVRRLLDIRPTASTRTLVRGLRGVLRVTATGVLIAVPSEAVLSADVRFTFTLSPRSAGLGAYSTMSLRHRTTVEAIEQEDDRLAVRRYRTEVPQLSNLTGTARGAAGDSGRRLFLSREYGAGPGERVEDLVVEDGRLLHLTSDAPGAGTQDLGATAELPVYVHQGDVPRIVPPPNVDGAPERGVELTADLPADTMAVIDLVARRPDDSEFDLLGADGTARRPHPVFEVHFRNRRTTWQFVRRDDGVEQHVEPHPLPLTHHGRAVDRQKPAASSLAVEVDPADSTRIARLVSVIPVH
ncbi:MAG: hypothetical protein L0H74_10810 [Brachybacterium sp.]|nr:hypothetical protein [Brachybacterium sp.]MDN5900547.1 hypothetical protein [Brachybacterium sp.]